MLQALQGPRGRSPPSSREWEHPSAEIAGKRYVTALAAGLVAYSIVLAVFSREGFPAAMQTDAVMPWLADKPVGEDGYYMLTVAWNFARGEGLTYNYGRITTGIQPLATLVYAGLAWCVQSVGGSRFLLVRIVLLLGMITMVMQAWLLAAIARRLAPDGLGGWAAAAAATITLTSFWLFRAHTYGLETGIYLCLLASCILMSMRVWVQATPRRCASFAILAGLAGLGRIDFGIVLPVFLLLGWIRGRLPVRAVLAVGAIAFAVVFPWLAYVYHATDRIVPSSGIAQSGIIGLETLTGRTSAFSVGLVQNMAPWIYAGGRTRLAALAVATLLACWAAARFVGEAREMTSARREVIAIWALSLAPLVFIYLFAFRASHFYGRYLAPVSCLSVPVVAVVSAELLARVRAVRLAVAVGLPLVFVVTSVASLHTGKIGNAHVVTARFVADHFPDARVGAFQSGVIGFFESNVMNLDGKIDVEALRYLEAGRLHEYIDSSRLDVLVDWPGHFGRLLPRSYLDLDWRPCGREIGNGVSVCFRRVRTTAE